MHVYNLESNKNRGGEMLANGR